MEISSTRATTPIIGKAREAPSFDGVPVRGGEWVQKEAENRFCDDAIVNRAVADFVLNAGNNYLGALIFAQGVLHAEKIKTAFASLGQDCEIVTGKTPKAERNRIVSDFKQMKIKRLINVGCFTTGFDAPHVDVIGLFRKTLSTGLFYQMVGRGLRKYPGKSFCRLLDYGDNIEWHGPITNLRPPRVPGKRGAKGESDMQPRMKKCPSCDELNLQGVTICGACGFEWPIAVRHNEISSSADPMQVKRILMQVTGWRWFVNQKQKGNEVSNTLAVDYQMGLERVTEYIAPESKSSFARKRAVSWWTKIGMPLPMPQTAAECKQLLDSADSEAKPPKSLTVQRGRYNTITDYHWED